MKRLATVLAVAYIALAQTRPIGSLVQIDAAAKRITIKTDSGSEMAVAFDDQTRFLRVAPGEKDLRNAAAIAQTDVAPGDRILARGAVSGDGKSVAATSVIVMAKGDIAGKQAADRAEWDRRGVGGIVKAVNPGARELTISQMTAGQSQAVVIALGQDAVLRRYPPGSVKFSEAKPAAFEEIQAGDQVRALGNKSADGARFTAEELVSGTFINIAATVEAVDAAENTVAVKDLATHKKFSVRVTPDSNLRRLPPFAARMLAARNAGMMPARVPEGAPREHTPDIQTMIERMPAVTLADLKAGDAVILASTREQDTSRLTAITMLSGVEPLFTSEDSRSTALRSWNLDLNMSLP